MMTTGNRWYKLVWSDKLYVGDGIKVTYKAVIADINIFWFSDIKNEYVVILAQNEKNLLEMIPVKELELAYYQEVELYAVGIAADKGEATEIVRRIMEDVYTAQANTDVRMYFNR